MIRDDAGGLSPLFIFTVGSIAFLLIVGAVVWFAIPGASAKHHFVSPSGRVALDIGETCGEASCERRIIAETIAADGSKSRRGCRVPLTDTHLVLLNAFPLWAADEQTVEIVYADAAGQGGKFPLNFAADCTATE
ncbi:hypothetical protein ASC89_10055 [Devosia sp. Root413D1]|uniref:hypothetical protein n=1 Tax=Devosia sp. Root413D1 TaxID=1736531 RepID=UPI0006FDB479|nr:hypothetical protein [Devosia sp. Root413D1]KQW80413.1 hypothetical protein ASC89_10055 [Devosia sp. Root413D1]